MEARARYNNIRFPYDSEEQEGLRNAQRGAIFSIASHNTLYTNEAGIVVMPTGSGKTAVLMTAPYVIQMKKVLIVMPSIMFRGQIYDDFRELRALKRIGVFTNDVICPKLYELKISYSIKEKE